MNEAQGGQKPPKKAEKRRFVLLIKTRPEHNSRLASDTVHSGKHGPAYQMDMLFLSTQEINGFTDSNVYYHTFTEAHFGLSSEQTQRNLEGYDKADVWVGFRRAEF